MKESITGKTIIDEEEKETLLWCSENEKLIEILKSNEDLRCLLTSFDEDELRKFTNALTSTYVKNCLDNSDRIHYVFESVRDDDPIYEQNCWTIEDYYHKLVAEYMIKTGLPYEMAKREFDTLSVSFEGLISNVKECNNDKLDETSSIKNIIKTNWDEKGNIRVRKIKNYLKGLHLPNYNKKYIVTPGEIDKTNELLKMQNEVLKAQVEHLKEQLVGMEQVDLKKQKSI